MFPLSHMLEVVRARRHAEGDRCGGQDARLRRARRARRSPCGSPTARSTASCSSIRARTPARPTWTGACASRTSTLRDFLTLFSINRLSLGTYPLQKVLRRVSRGLKRFQQANPVGKAQQNVAHHYDLGNDFYKLFLDEGMQYSCAYFLDDTESLEQAQQNKLRLIAAKLNLKPGLKVLDIGSGWGDLALYLAALEDVDVTASRCRRSSTRCRTRGRARRGLADRVRFELQDYREVTERFDRIVSVGMFEHVGVHHYGEFFAKVNALIDDDGVMLLHSIGHMSPPGTASPWLQEVHLPRRLFAGAVGGVHGGGAGEPVGDGPRVPAPALCQDARALVRALRGQPRQDRARCTTSASAACGSSISISAEMMFRTGSQLVFHMQLPRKRDAAPIVRDYITDLQRHYREMESPAAPAHGAAAERRLQRGALPVPAIASTRASQARHAWSSPRKHVPCTDSRVWANRYRRTNALRSREGSGEIAKCISSISPARRYCRIVATPPPTRTSLPLAASRARSARNGSRR